MSEFNDSSFGEDNIEDLLFEEKIEKDFNFFFKEGGEGSVPKENHPPTLVNEIKEKNGFFCDNAHIC